MHDHSTLDGFALGRGNRERQVVSEITDRRRAFLRQRLRHAGVDRAIVSADRGCIAAMKSHRKEEPDHARPQAPTGKKTRWTNQ